MSNGTSTKHNTRLPREITPGEHASLIATVLGLPRKPEPQPEKKRA